MINKKTYDIGGEILRERGIPGERHHHRGRQYADVLGMLNDIILCGVIPLTEAEHAAAHTLMGKRVPLAAMRPERKLILLDAMIEQIDRIAARTVKHTEYHVWKK